MLSSAVELTPHTVRTIFPLACPSPMYSRASAISLSSYRLSHDRPHLPLSRKPRRTSMSALLNFAMKKTSFRPLPIAAKRT